MSFKKPISTHTKYRKKKKKNQLNKITTTVKLDHQNTIQITPNLTKTSFLT